MTDYAKVIECLVAWADSSDMGRKPDPESIPRQAAAAIEALIAERDAYQQAADKMAAEHKVEREALQMERDHAMQDCRHWIGEYKDLQSKNELLKRDCGVANLGFEANSKTIAFLKADNERLANNFKVNLAALHKVSNEKNALQVQLDELSKLKTIVRKFMDKALPAGVCKTCEGEGEIGGQFCGGFQNCPDCNATRMEKPCSQNSTT